MSALLIAFLLQQPILKDIHILATPLDKAVSKLGIIYNSPMDVSNLIKNQIVLIDATQVSEQEVRDQIAKTLNASWEKKENGWHLTKTNEQQKQDERRIVEFRLRFLQKTFDIRAKSEGLKADYSANFARQTFNQLRNEAKGNGNRMRPPGPTAAGYALPNQRFMSKFLLKFGTDRIAAVGNNRRAVFALHPNSMQLPLNVDLTDDIAKMNAEQAIWLKTMLDTTKDQESQGKETHVADNEVQVTQAIMGDGDQAYNDSHQFIPQDLANIYFTVYCSEEGTYSLKLVATPVDSKQEAFSVSATTFEGAFAGLGADDFEIKPQAEFELSDQAKDFQSYFFRGEKKIPESRLKTMIDQFANPVAHDPLSYGLSEAMIFDARRFKKNIFACLEDQNLNVFEPYFGDIWFDKRFQSMNDGVVHIDGNWIGVRKYPFTEPNIPRNDLKAIITRVREHGRVEVEDRAALAALRPRTNSYSYIEGMIGRFVNASREESAEDDALKCIGLLTAGERAGAFRPEGIPYAQLNSRLQSHLFQCAYYNEHNRLWQSGQQRQQIPNFVIQEATLMAPDGILANSIFRIQETAQDQIKDGDEPGSIGLMADAKGWGGIKYQLDHPEEFRGINFKFDVNRKLTRVRVRTWAIKLHVNPRSEWSSTIQKVDTVARNAFTIASLPDDFKADFDEGYKASADAAKRRREIQKNRNGGGGKTQQNR